jgi:hypothetical protein
MKASAHRKPPAKPSQRVERALNKLRKFYERGEGDLERFPDNYGRYVTLRREKRLGAAERVRKARLMADETAGYSRKSLNDLIHQCRMHNFGIGVTHVIRLLSVPSGRQREGLQRQAIQGKWTRRQLDLAIRLQQGIRRPYARRPMRLPKDKAEALWLVEKNCDHWERLCKAVVPNGESLLPDKVAEKLGSIGRAVATLAVMVKKSLQRVSVKGLSPR